MIDDDPVSTFLLVDLVESIGLPYAVYENAVKFLEQDLHGLQGCIVSDLRMPVISGLDLQDGFDLVDCASCRIAPACGLTSVLDEALAAFLDILDRYSLAQVLARRGDFSYLLGSMIDTVEKQKRPTG